MSVTIPMPARGGGKPAPMTMKMTMHQDLNIKLDSVK